MKTTYILGIDAAKHKIRAALRDAHEQLLFEKDLPVSAAGCARLLAQIREHVPAPEQLLVLIEATGVLHLHWSAALSKAGYAVAVLNPLMARRLYTVENSIRENKTDPIDARGLCAIGALHGEKLLAHYRFGLKPEQFALQRLQTVRKALRNALTNLKKTYQSVLELSFPELGALLEVDGVASASSAPGAHSGRDRAEALSTLEKKLEAASQSRRPQSAGGRLHRRSGAGRGQRPSLASHPPGLGAMEARLRSLDQQIETLAGQSVDPQTKALVESMPGFGPTTAAKVLAYLPSELLHSGSNRKVAARLQAFMGNDPRLKESGQWKGQTKMSKRGVETLRTAFFQAAFSAAQHDPELKAFTSANAPKAKLTTSLSAISCASSPAD